MVNSLHNLLGPTTMCAEKFCLLPDPANLTTGKTGPMLIIFVYLESAALFCGFRRILSYDMKVFTQASGTDWPARLLRRRTARPDCLFLSNAGKR